MRIPTYLAHAKRLAIRHRVSLQDLSLLIATVLVTAYWLYEVDLFVAKNTIPVKNAIEPDEWSLLGAVLSLGLLLFAWRRFSEQKREARRRLAAEERVRELAFQDPLTGLPNRRQFVDALEGAVGAPPRSGGVHALLMLDLNGFKQVNDVYGHGVGDELLIRVGERLLAAAETGDLVARLGGDEFAILAQHLASMEAATGLALRVIAGLSVPINVGRVSRRIDAGIGICLFPFEGCSAEEVMRRADTALYKAKSDRQAPARFFDEDMDRSIREREFMERELRAAVIAKEIKPVFQPLVDLGTKKVIGFEAIPHWINRDLGEIPPSRFIPIAEDSMLIHELSDQILRLACRAAREWPKHVKLEYNISPIQLKDPTLGIRVLAILGECGLSPSRLEVAIPESALVRDLSAAQESLGALRQAGVRIVVDGFGTGYSSLYHLRHFKLDKIKIDRGFIANMSSERESAEIVNALVGLGLGLGFTVTADGIERPDQESELIARGCQEGQGHLFGTAVPLEETKKFFEEHPPIGKSAANPYMSSDARP
jgi:diguanylate cyclase (GGDEF)-like protein